MTLEEFNATLAEASPPRELPVLLKALWYDAKEDWERAHQLAQSVEDRDGAWVHAYLHRKEGDDSNASYWYARARRNFSRKPLAGEWEELVSDLLGRSR